MYFLIAKKNIYEFMGRIPFQLRAYAWIYIFELLLVSYYAFRKELIDTYKFITKVDFTKKSIHDENKGLHNIPSFFSCWHENKCSERNTC